MAATIEIAGETLSDARVLGICDALLGSKLRMLSLRNCVVNDKAFKKIMACVANSKTILQLALSVGVVKDLPRVKILALALQKNRSLVSLLVNGNPFGDEGMEILGTSLAQHPNIVSLDVGDCNLGDESLEYISDLLPPNGGKPGLTDLTLSANTSISPEAWAKFAVALAVSSQLRELYVDYNRLGDYAASCLLVGLTSNRQIEILDLEGTGITDHTAKLLSYLVENFPVKLRRVVLAENKIDEVMIREIKQSLDDDSNSDVQSLASTDLYTTGQSANDSLNPLPKPVEVKLHHVEPVGTNKPLKKGKKNRKNTTISSLGETDDRDKNSDIKDDTVATDEDYKVLAKALEAGLSTGGTSDLGLTGHSQTFDEEDESSEEGDILTEVPATEIHRKVLKVTNVSQKSHTTDWNSLGELIDDDDDEGELLK
ncbi:leucine-rich repeat-containing protein 73-like [Mizuhopecten yessoensis]|uniref:Leucine-rich repeat-containing protein 73 n=1 Tax=Mizuhopecten yessoensis TaxID=6573 RepID=A0A210QJE6_MIZYE|nr:leucine-rich repeat-containing protein 73-like [Mizuhopecten yessoensis]OWF48711.1 Leucine-rich repeat-containing protein 73 [Mizuhopecten yessoensis]